MASWYWMQLGYRTVIGIPKGQPRGRAFVTGGKARVFTPGTAEAWKGAVALAFGDWIYPTLDVPVYLVINFLLPRPKGLMRSKDPEGTVPAPKRPDIDNLWKATTDALTELGVWRDDALIVQTLIRKDYHGKTGKPGATIGIYVQEEQE